MDAFLRRALELMLGLEQANRWQDLIAEIKGYTALADELLERRPDVSDTIGKALSDSVRRAGCARSRNCTTATTRGKPSSKTSHARWDRHWFPDSSR